MVVRFPTNYSYNRLHFKKFIHVTTIVHLWSNYVGVLQKGVGDSGHRLKGVLLLDDVDKRDGWSNWKTKRKFIQRCNELYRAPIYVNFINFTYLF